MQNSLSLNKDAVIYFQGVTGVTDVTGSQAHRMSV